MLTFSECDIISLYQIATDLRVLPKFSVSYAFILNILSLYRASKMNIVKGSYVVGIKSLGIKKSRDQKIQDKKYRYRNQI
jgi:hypothetical protein